MDPCPYLVKYSLDVPKKKSFLLGISNTDKKCLTKKNVESSPQEIWTRIHFLEISGSPSLDSSISYIHDRCSQGRGLHPHVKLKINDYIL